MNNSRLGGADPEPNTWVPTSTHQLLGEQQSRVVITLQSPRGKAQDVFLVLLDLGHGPVLPFQALLLPLCYLLQVESRRGQGGNGTRTSPPARMASAASRGSQTPRTPLPELGRAVSRQAPHRKYLGVVDQHTAPLVQFLHYLQDGHLNVHLHALLYVGHLADPGGWRVRSGPVRQVLTPGPPPSHWPPLTSCEPPWCSSAVLHACPRGASPMRPGACAGFSLHPPGTGT